MNLDLKKTREDQGSYIRISSSHVTTGNFRTVTGKEKNWKWWWWAISNVFSEANQITSGEPERTQPEENMSSRPEQEQGITRPKEYTPERENIYNEIHHVGTPVPTPLQSEPSQKGLQWPRWQHTRLFTYDRLVSLACYNLRILQQHAYFKVLWSHTVQHYYTLMDWVNAYTLHLKNKWKWTVEHAFV